MSRDPRTSETRQNHSETKAKEKANGGKATPCEWPLASGNSQMPIGNSQLGIAMPIFYFEWPSGHWGMAIWPLGMFDFGQLAAPFWQLPNGSFQLAAPKWQLPISGSGSTPSDTNIDAIQVYT